MHVANSGVVYRATVIGAGPAGLSCLGNLLSHLPSTDRILWIDPAFQAGRLSTYPAVPSNTKVCLFTRFAEECPVFKAGELESLRVLKEEMDGQKGCQLKFAAELCKEITEKLLETENVKSIKSTAESLEYFDDTWTIKTKNDLVFKSKMVFLTTGSKPKSLNNLPDDSIDLDDALNPEILMKKIQNYDSVSVYGSSHSAMLVLKNLQGTAKKKNVTNYYRQPIKFASFPDPLNSPDKILHDNTGLKGEVAEWVKNWIELDETELKNNFNLVRIKSGEKSDVEIGKNVNIFAVGYERNPLPKIILNHKETPHHQLDYTATGQLTSQSTPLPNIYGYGIAFPERVKDLDGTDEAAVGMWKFMKHVKKSIEQILNK